MLIQFDNSGVAVGVSRGYIFSLVNGEVSQLAGARPRFFPREPRRYALHAKPARFEIRIADAQLTLTRNPLAEEEELGALLELL